MSDSPWIPSCSSDHSRPVCPDLEPSAADPNLSGNSSNIGESDRWIIFAASAIAKWQARKPLNDSDHPLEMMKKVRGILYNRDIIPEDFKVARVPENRHLRTMWRQFCSIGHMSKLNKGSRPSHNLREPAQYVCEEEPTKTASEVARLFDNEISRQTIVRH